MWFSAVVVVSCLVLGAISAVVDIKDNAISSDEYLQEFVTRTKKSPDHVVTEKKTREMSHDKIQIRSNYPYLEKTLRNIQKADTIDNEVSNEMTAILAKDIKTRLNNLEEIESEYEQLKTDSINRRGADKEITPQLNGYLNSKTKPFLESELFDKPINEEELTREARQYNQDSQHYQDFYGDGIMSSEKANMNQGRYLGVAVGPLNMYGDKGEPYLAQFNPSMRTYAEAQGEVHVQEKPVKISPITTLKQLKQIIPNVINVLAEITAPTKPVQTVSGGHGHGGHAKTVQEVKPVKKPEAIKPVQGSGHIGISTSPVFFSKQVIFGIGGDKKPVIKDHGTQVPSEHTYYAPITPSYSSGHYESSGSVGLYGSAEHPGLFGYTGVGGFSGYPGSFGYTGVGGLSGYPGSFGYSEFVGPSGSIGYSGYPGSLGSYYSPPSYWTPPRDEHVAPGNVYTDSNDLYSGIYTASPETEVSKDSKVTPYSESSSKVGPLNKTLVKAYTTIDNSFKPVTESEPAYRTSEGISLGFPQSEPAVQDGLTNAQNITLEEINSAIEKVEQNLKEINAKVFSDLNKSRSKEKQATEPSITVMETKSVVKRRNADEKLEE